MVIWIIGLSGSGKTTLSNLLASSLRTEGKKVVLLDGDEIRDVFKNDVDHSISGRNKNAERLSKLSYFLSTQDVIVIAAVLSIFPKWQKWNHDNIKNYYQVYIKVPVSDPHQSH